MPRIGASLKETFFDKSLYINWIPAFAAVLQYLKPVIPEEQCAAKQDTWFDRLTTLSGVEGESRKWASSP